MYLFKIYIKSKQWKRILTLLNKHKVFKDTFDGFGHKSTGNHSVELFYYPTNKLQIVKMKKITKKYKSITKIICR